MINYKSRGASFLVKGALSRGFSRFLVLTVLKPVVTLPMKNIIFEDLKEDIALICGYKPNYGYKYRFFYEDARKQLEKFS